MSLPSISALTSAGAPAPVNLSRPGTYLHWHFFLISTANLGVVVGMLLIFVLALVVPFPGHGGQRTHRGAPDEGEG